MPWIVGRFSGGSAKRSALLQSKGHYRAKPAETESRRRQPSSRRPDAHPPHPPTPQPRRVSSVDVRWAPTPRPSWWVRVPTRTRVVAYTRDEERMEEGVPRAEPSGSQRHAGERTRRWMQKSPTWLRRRVVHPAAGRCSASASYPTAREMSAVNQACKCHCARVASACSIRRD